MIIEILRKDIRRFLKDKHLSPVRRTFLLRVLNLVEYCKRTDWHYIDKGQYPSNSHKFIQSPPLAICRETLGTKVKDIVIGHFDFAEQKFVYPHNVFRDTTIQRVYAWKYLDGIKENL